MGIAEAVDAAVRLTGAPIDGVAIGERADKATWRIDFKADATDEQRAAALAALAAFDANGTE